ncbi:MAG: dienelactone hydrolase family protein [Arenicellales bacterium]
MTGTFIDVSAPDDSGTFRGYLSTPPTGSGPGILLLQEIFGINSHIRSVADRYAREGFTVLAPDMFWRLEPGVELGYSEEERAKAYDLYGRFDLGLAISDMQAAAHALTVHPRCDGTFASMGFCLGGKLSYLAAAHCSPDAAVIYYGVRIEQDLQLADQIRCPMLMHFAELDALVPASARDAIQNAFASRENVTLHLYSKCDHAFNTRGRDSFNEGAAQLAYGRTIAFLNNCLGLSDDG